MNLYIVTEGATEKTVYRHWIPLLNPTLSHVDFIQQVKDCNFFIFSAKGYALIPETIDAAIQDVNTTGKFDRLIISVDSEGMTKEDKVAEIEALIVNKPCIAQIHIVVQHFCFETWPLGNRRFIRKNPRTARLARYKGIYDVRIKDPELLPPCPDEDLNRAQFAVAYLKRAANERGVGKSYSKSNPLVVCHPKFFAQVLKRYNETGDIASFADFITAVT